MEAKAVAKTIRVSPQKARLVVDLVRGKTVKEALGILEYTNKAASPAISKVVKSAAQNAVYNNDADAEKLYVKAIFVDEGPILKRFAARAKGSGTRILKRTCHITCVVDESQIMGQKVSPVGLRVGINRNWDSRWYANDQDFAGLLHEDIKVRDYILKKLKTASVAKVEIERSKNRVTIFVHTSRPGVVIGKDGEAVDALRKEVSKLVSSKQVFINIVEIKNPDVVAQLVANNIAEQLENRASFRTVQKRAIQRAMRAGAKGIKTNVSGRLGGADMARAEGYSEGNVPLHTLRADIDYATAEADTTYGKLGVKVWICKGEILPEKKKGDK